MYEMDLTDGAILEKGHVYLVPLLEQLALPKTIRARANPKSTTGRLDVFTRVVTDLTCRIRRDPCRLSRPALPGGRPPLICHQSSHWTVAEPNSICVRGGHRT